MGVVTARLVFLAFFALTGTIIYNALYLQEHGLNGAPPATTTARKSSGSTQTAAAEPERVPPVSTDLPPLDPGTGESQLVVRAVQRELSVRGYDVGEVNGTLSDKTRAAIAAFQKAQGLAVTGLPSDDLLRQILLGDSLENAGATGSVAEPPAATESGESATVKGVQRVLAELGYAPGAIDGEWGTNTANAVRAFQRDRNIAETGQITPELLAEIERVTGRDSTRTAARP